MKHIYSSFVGAVFAFAIIAAIPQLSVADLSITTSDIPVLVDDTGMAPTTEEVHMDVVLGESTIAVADSSVSVSTASGAHIKTVGAFAADARASVAGKVGDAEFCEALDAAFMRQSSDVRAAYAWNATSYQSSLAKADKAGLSAYGNAEGYLAMQKDIENIAAKSGELNGMQSMRAKALLRSSMLALLIDTKADATTASDLKNLRDAGARCVAFFSNDAAAATALAKTSATIPVATSNDTIPESFVEATLETHESLRDIDADGERVRVTFVERGKLFGFIPTWIKRTATVHADGSATLSGGGLSKKSGLYSEAALQEAIDALTLSTTETLSSATQQKIVVTVAGYVETK